MDFANSRVSASGRRLPLVAAATAAAAVIAATTTSAATAAAAVATAAAAATTAIAAAATATTAAAIAAATTAAAAEAAATTATAAAFLARLGFIDAQRTTIEVGAVHRLDGGLPILVRGHFHEREATRTTSVPVEHDLDLRHLPAVAAECSAQRILGGLEGEVTYIQSRTHLTITSPFADGMHRRSKGRTPPVPNELGKARVSAGSKIDRQNNGRPTTADATRSQTPERCRATPMPCKVELQFPR
jgi:hypothetical protein